MFRKIKKSAQNLGNTRVLCTSGIMAALFVALYAIKFPITSTLRISFTFVPIAIIGWLFGPVPAMITGGIGDVIGCMLFPAGAYFPGFTISTIVIGFIFGVFLYEKDSKKIYLPVIVSKTLVSFLVNVILNSMWLSLIYGKVWTVYAGTHLIKNLIALPIEAVILILIIKLLSSQGIRKMYK